MLFFSQLKISRKPAKEEPKNAEQEADDDKGDEDDHDDEMLTDKLDVDDSKMIAPTTETESKAKSEKIEK